MACGEGWEWFGSLACFVETQHFKISVSNDWGLKLMKNFHWSDWAFGNTHCWLLLYLWDLHGSTFDFAWIYFHSGQVCHCQLHDWHSINWCFKSRRFKIRNSVQGIVVGRIDPQRWLGTAGEITGKDTSRYLQALDCSRYIDRRKFK